jgi:NADH-quinone oxidoreductase subunit G
MPTVTIDGKSIEVEPGTVIIEAARRLGIPIPHFCWHEALRPSGNCRICLVEVEKARGPQIACMTPCADGMVVHTESEAAMQSQNAVMEFLLLNHPLDCTICDQAGECKLQRYSYDYGSAASRLDMAKVKKPKAIPFSEHIMFDAERCILCTRCVRFFEDVRGKSVLGLVNRGTYNEISVADGESIEDNYSMNIVDICPVGALTTQDFRFKSRVWFLEQKDSVCTGCAKGCNVQVSARDGKIYRYVPRTNAKVNGHWMCDYGRMSHHAMAGDDRLDRPYIKMGGGLEEVEWVEALDRVHELLSSASGQVDFIASTEASLEDLWLFRRLVDHAGKGHLARVTRTGEGDGFLLQADRTPNANGADLLGYPPAGSLHFEGGGMVVLGDDLAGAELPAKRDFLIVFGWRRGALFEKADVVLPMAGVGEVDQTFINDTHRLQLARQAVSPPGEALPGYVVFPGLERRFGSAPQFNTAEEAFGAMRDDVTELEDLPIPRMLRIDPLGVSLDGEDEREAV